MFGFPTLSEQISPVFIRHHYCTRENSYALLSLGSLPVLFLPDIVNDQIVIPRRHCLSCPFSSLRMARPLSFDAQSVLSTIPPYPTRTLRGQVALVHHRPKF